MSSSGEPRIAKEATNGQPLKQESQLGKPMPSMDSINLNVLAVKLRNVSFSYRRFIKGKNTIEDINMSCPRSGIYGLLGPSGCGKTTLLKLILGLKKQTKGTIEVNGRKPLHPLNKIPGSGVGFQPQETALYQEFNIQETLQYFAKIYGMTAQMIKKRTEFLIDFLQLPAPESKIGTLSGGQQRRVSLAVTIVHNPPFLILDEPTVGVDPLLREKIWGHLVELSKIQKTSILITTHYVEEARRAHVVALMRSGRLLVEHSPEFLMNYFRVDNLELMFLKVCEAQETKSRTNDQSMPKSFFDREKDKEKIVSLIKSSVGSGPAVKPIVLNPSAFKRLTALTGKNYTRISRNVLMLCFQILCPAFSMLLFLICVGALPKMLKVAYYNEEAVSPTNVSNLCGIDSFGDMFLKQIRKEDNIDLIEYKVERDAKQSVKDGKTFGELVIYNNFTENLCNRVSNTSHSLDQGTIFYYSDMTDITIHTTIVRDLYRAERLLVSQIVKIAQEQRDNGSSVIKTPNAEAIKPILEVSENPIYGKVDITFRDFMTPGMTISVVFILAVGLTALSFVAEKKEGVMDRTLLAGVKIYEILFTQIFIQIFVLLVQVICLLLLIFIAFKSENKGSLALIILIILMQGVLGMTYGLIISILTPDEQSALMIAFGSFFPLMIMSGVFWPIEGMPHILQYVSFFLPQTLPVMSLRFVMLKGWPLTHQWVWFGFASNTIWFIVLSIASVILSSIWT